MILEWSEEYATNYDSIDRQHKKLFQYVNQLDELLRSDVFQQDKINELLDFLENYTVVHFEHEEMCMKRDQCPMGEKNKVAHDYFLNFYREFRGRYKTLNSEQEKRIDLQKLLTTMESWLKSHICKIDVHMRSCKK